MGMLQKKENKGLTYYEVMHGNRKTGRDIRQEKSGERKYMVDWRKIPKIDAHIHLTPKDVIDANIDYDGRFIVNGSIDDYEKIMKTYNIECAFIMPFNDPYMLSIEPAVEAVNKNMKNMRMIIKFS